MMVHDWEYERASAEGDALCAWADPLGLDVDDPATRVAWELELEERRAANEP